MRTASNGNGAVRGQATGRRRNPGARVALRFESPATTGFERVPGVIVVAPPPRRRDARAGRDGRTTGRVGRRRPGGVGQRRWRRSPEATLSGRTRLSKHSPIRIAQGHRCFADRIRPCRLGLPDGELANHEDRLTESARENPADRGSRTWCAATWRGDGHPDHEAVGTGGSGGMRRAPASRCWSIRCGCGTGPRPADPAVPWDRARSIPRPAGPLNRKRQAAQCFRSQFEPRSR